MSNASFPLRFLHSLARRCCRLPLAALLLALACAAAGAEAPVGVERSVKAAFLYKFLGYAEFPAAAVPAEPAAPLTIGVIGAAEIAAELSRITAGRLLDGRAVAVRVVQEGDALAGIHLLFLGNADIAHPEKLLAAAQQLGILTVTESDHGLQQGSVINFRLIEERIRFEVSLQAADKSNLKLSSRLLSVAFHVQKAAP